MNDCWGEQMMFRQRAGKLLVILALAVSLTVGLARQSQALFDKTRFVTDLGVAYFCFHHWVANPYREGKFQNGAPHRTATIVKAGVALLFAVNRIKAANRIAHTSKDPLLHKVAGSLDNMTNSFDSIGRKFKSGNFGKGDVDSLTGAYTSMDSSARAANLNVKDVPIAVPGA
jgi:hypothetical protein